MPNIEKHQFHAAVAQLAPLLNMTPCPDFGDSYWQARLIAADETQPDLLINMRTYGVTGGAVEISARSGPNDRRATLATIGATLCGPRAVAKEKIAARIKKSLLGPDTMEKHRKHLAAVAAHQAREAADAAALSALAAAHPDLINLGAAVSGRNQGPLNAGISLHSARASGLWGYGEIYTDEESRPKIRFQTFTVEPEAVAAFLDFVATRNADATQ